MDFEDNWFLSIFYEVKLKFQFIKY